MLGKGLYFASDPSVSAMVPFLFHFFFSRFILILI